MTRTYTVRWEIDVDAESPKEAAKQALEIQRDPESLATVFEVFEYGAHEYDLSGVIVTLGQDTE